MSLVSNRLTLALLFIYLVCIASGFDVILPTLTGFQNFKPFLVFTPLLFFATLFQWSHIKLILSDIKPLLLYLLGSVLLVSLHFAVVGNYSGSHLVSLAAYYHFGLTFLCLLLLSTINYLKPVFSKAISFGLCIAITLNLVERIVQLPFTMQSTRSAGFFLNPNGSSESIVFLILVKSLIDRVKDSNLDTFAGAAIAGVFATLSRSGLILMTVSYAGLLYQKIIKFSKVVKSLAIVLVVFGAVLLLRTANFENGSFVVNDSFPKNGAASIVAERIQPDSSASQRFELLKEGLQLIADQGIILGKGVGFLSDKYQRTHNVFVENWIELGIFSLFYIPFLLVFIFLKAPAFNIKLFSVLVFLDGFFSHNTLNSKIIALGVAICLARTLVKDTPDGVRNES